jgi:hypothetical protein
MLKHPGRHTTVLIVPACAILYIPKHCVGLATTGLTKPDTSISTKDQCNSKRTATAGGGCSSAHLPIREHAAVIASHAVLHHRHPSNLEETLLYSTGTRAFRHSAKGTEENYHDTGKQSKRTCVTCSSATRSKVNLDSGWPVQVTLWPLSCLTHLLLPCSDISLPLSGRTRMTTCGRTDSVSA